MAIKKLQNNFTTPEQSKRLLELGLPTDSADCYLTRFGIDEDWEVKMINNIKYSELAISNQKYYLPCWSVGRLMEIFDMCCVREQTYNAGWCSYRRLHRNQTYLDYILYVFTINKMRGLLNFSKLEE